jgi:2,5-dihydroxypyridine 5,6-dioxygenase
MPYPRDYASPLAGADLAELFRHQLAACRLTPGETCLAITDTAWNPAASAACLAAARALGAEVAVLTLPSAGPLPAALLGPAVMAADLTVYMTAHTLHYRPEVRAALDAGRRVLCAMQPFHVMRRLSADPEVRRRARAGAARLEAARTIRITSPAGTDLVMDKTGRRGLAAYGYADEPGHLDFWGGGMVQTAQLEGMTEGRLVLDVGDVCFHLARFVESPVTIAFERGRAVDIAGGLDARLIRRHLEEANDPNAFLAGHIAWGVDPRARWLTPIVDTPDQGGGGADSEAVYGNVQVEIGSNDDVLFGGRNRTGVHLGLCLLGASLFLDGEPILVEGRFVPSDLV